MHRGTTHGLYQKAVKDVFLEAGNFTLFWVSDFCWFCGETPDVSIHQHKDIILIRFYGTIQYLYPDIYA